MNILPKDCTILVDKEKGVTSFDALYAIKKRVNKKTGHAGTLDKFASGLLIVMCGKNCKKCQEYMGFNKTYIADIYFGKETDTLDIYGKVINESKYVPTLGEIILALENNFKGEIMQAPPLFSALHINGKRAYELALKNIDFAIEKRKVNIYSYRILDYSYPVLKIEFVVSKGTYIRSIARDLGRLLNCFAHLSALRRTKIGEFNIDKAIASNKILDCENLIDFMLV